MFISRAVSSLGFVMVQSWQPLSRRMMCKSRQISASPQSAIPAMYPKLNWYWIKHNMWWSAANKLSPQKWPVTSNFLRIEIQIIIRYANIHGPIFSRIPRQYAIWFLPSNRLPSCKKGWIRVRYYNNLRPCFDILNISRPDIELGTGKVPQAFNRSIFLLETQNRNRPIDGFLGDNLSFSPIIFRR